MIAQMHKELHVEYIYDFIKKLNESLNRKKYEKNGLNIKQAKNQ